MKQGKVAEESGYEEKYIGVLGAPKAHSDIDGHDRDLQSS